MKLVYIDDEELARMRDAARAELLRALRMDYGMETVEDVTGGLDESEE